MISYIIRRILLIIPTLIGIMVINFFIIQTAPGGPVERLIAQVKGSAVDATARITRSGGESDQAAYESARSQGEDFGKYRGAQGLDPEFIKEIEKLLDRMKSEVENSGTYSVETDARFHLRVAQASGNAVFFNIMKYIMDLLRERLWDFIIDGPLANAEDLKKDLEFHEDILRCIKENDQKSVRPSMLRRFNEIQKVIEQ